MRIIYTLVLLVNVFAAAAQVPGYMGKRFTIFADANPTPAFFVMNMNNTVLVNPGGDDARTQKVNRFAFNVRPQVTLEYLIHKRVSLGVSYSMPIVGTTRAYYTSAPSEIDGVEYNTDEYDVVKGQALGLHLKFYDFAGSASVPPIGYYRTINIFVTRTNTYDNKKSTAKQFRDDFMYPAVSFGVGRQSMLAKNLLLKTGVEFGWAFVPTNFLTEVEDDWNVQEYSGYSVHQSLAGYYLFNINIGLGYILF